MLDNRYDPTSVLDAYPADCRGDSITTVVSGGGFSGSQIWRIEAARGPLCLRKWPKEHPDPAQLRYIHAVVSGVVKAGCSIVPVPIPTESGETLVHCDGHLWQLEPWLPGEATYKSTALKVEAALRALAEFHRAVSANPKNLSGPEPPPGILKRLDQLLALESGGFETLAARIVENRRIWPELSERSVEVISNSRIVIPHAIEQARNAVKLEVPIRPCIRDVHREHVLFQGDTITGLVDFGAMRPDSPACDIARLLGSMALDNAELWQIGLAAFTAVFPLSDQEHGLVPIYDESSVLLSGINWLRWIFVEQRVFENRPAILARFDEIAARLRHQSCRQGTIAV